MFDRDTLLDTTSQESYYNRFHNMQPADLWAIVQRAREKDNVEMENAALILFDLWLAGDIRYNPDSNTVSYCT